jgi:hypothetical protein
MNLHHVKTTIVQEHTMFLQEEREAKFGRSCSSNAENREMIKSFIIVPNGSPYPVRKHERINL